MLVNIATVHKEDERYLLTLEDHTVRFRKLRNLVKFAKMLHFQIRRG